MDAPPRDRVSGANLGTIEWFDKCRRRGPLVLIFYRGEWCDSSVSFLRQVSDSLGELKERFSGLQVYGISPQDSSESEVLEKKLALQFHLLGSPDNELAIFLLEKGFVDVYDPLVVGGKSLDSSTLTTVPVQQGDRRASCAIQPGILITTRHRILHSWALEERNGIDFGLTPNNEWPTIESIINIIEDELSDDSPHKLTPTSDSVPKRSLFSTVFRFGSTGSNKHRAASKSPQILSPEELEELEIAAAVPLPGESTSSNESEGQKCIIS